MSTYEGFQIRCGCRCAKCGSAVVLDGYSDAEGNHYCAFCNDYVKVMGVYCAARTPEKVAHREQIIIKAGADKD